MGEEEATTTLHIAMLPWLAFGHLIPFLELSIALANFGHRISFLSTPKNINKLPKIIPHHLLPLITFINLPLPSIEGLPEHAESTNDIPLHQTPLLKTAYDLLESPIKHFLKESSPSYIIHDLLPYWACVIAHETNVKPVQLCTFPASVLSFLGPLEFWTEEGRRGCWPTPESMTVKPKWIPFHDSKVAFNRHEAEAFHLFFFGSNSSGLSDMDRARICMEGSEVIAIRSCREYEGEYLDLLAQFYHGKLVIPVGLLPPVINSDKVKNSINDDSWRSVFSWLDEQKPKSIVYVSFGSEYKLNPSEVSVIAHGLEQSNVPFLWALRRATSVSTGEDDIIEKALPDGFVGRVEGRGVVIVGWAPQLEILAHPSIGGSLFHCGLGSIVETLRWGHVLILMPLIFDQGLNARLLVEKGVGIEVERDEDGGFFNKDEIARCLRIAMVDDDGERLRAKAKELGAVFADQMLHDQYVKRFAVYLCRALKKSDGVETELVTS